MTTKQRSLYFRKWGKIYKSYREMGYSAAEAADERYAIHAMAGAPRSSKEFSNADLDRVLEQMDAILHPDELPERAERSQKSRLVWAIEKVVESAGWEDGYLRKIVEDKYGLEGSRVDDWREWLDAGQLEMLLMTLKARARNV